MLGPVALFGVVFEGVLHKINASFAEDIQGAVAGKGIDREDRRVQPLQAVEAGREVFLFVVGEEDDGERNWHLEEDREDYSPGYLSVINSESLWIFVSPNFSKERRSLSPVRR